MFQKTIILSAIQRSFTRLTLTSKMLLLTLVISLTTGVILDGIQTQHLRTILQQRQHETLKKKAEEARVRFDNYVTAYEQAIKIIASQVTLYDHIAQQDWSSSPTAVKTYDAEIPPWLPDSSLLRKLSSVYYALLFDQNGTVREIYRGWPDPIPQSLLEPNNLFLILGEGQAHMTNVEDAPYIITSMPVYSQKKKVIASLMLASPLNNDLVMTSQGFIDQTNLIALSTGSEQKIFASNNRDLLPSGTRIEDLKNDYIISSKGFFDSGASDLEVQFNSLISKDEYVKLSAALLSLNREQRLMAFTILIGSFVLVMLWITRSIRRLTERVTSVSKNALGITSDVHLRGDELFILHNQFQQLALEVTSSHESLENEKALLLEANTKLKTVNYEIDRGRTELQLALDEVSALIQKVSAEKNLDITLLEPGQQRCYEHIGCNRKDCVCYENPGKVCWETAGAFCTNPLNQEGFANKYADCSFCPVYNQAASNPLHLIGDRFNRLMNILSMQHSELEQAYTDLKTAQSQILQQEKMASIGHLAAGVAHEINNPMGFIISNLKTFHTYIESFREFIRSQNEIIDSLAKPEISAVVEKKRKELDVDYSLEDAAELIKESADGANRIKVIVQNLKSFSRIDESERKASNINEGIESTLTIAWNELKYKATVNEELGNIPLTVCNLGRLNQVFMNLLINAAQAIKTQGEITVKTWSENNFIYISISDTGCGIPKDIIPRIFDPFFTTKDVGQGTGLGLSISYDIVKNHDGDITVASEVGKGTTFTIRLPVIS